jgi:insecticidal toxin complex protein TccC
MSVRIVQFHRADETQIAEGRINHHRFDPLGRLIASSDPRLFALAQADPEVPANLTRTLSLSGLELLSESVDAGWHIRLLGEAGQPLEQWDGRGTYGVVEYDSLLRPLTIHERGQDQLTRVVERFAYGGPGVDEAAHNGCGQLIRHDHPAGTDRFEEYSIRAAVLRDSRAFLQSMEMPDWPLSEAARDPLLESVPPLVTRYAYNPLGETVAQTDAYGNVQRFEMTCAGALRSSHLKLTGQPEQLLVNELGYNASGQLERQTGGNGVTSTHVYDPANGLLTRLTAARMDGTALQDLNYQYDPAGNVLSIEDMAQPTRYFRNQVTRAINTYCYDTLYQLIQATGREIFQPAAGPHLPDFQSPADPGQLVNYSQSYRYDAGGNIQALTHVGGRNYTQEWVTARLSNRSLLVGDHRPDEAEIAGAFDLSGNLLALKPGQPLSWDVRNQLHQVTPVRREEADDDHEAYRYDGAGQRLRKVRITQGATVAHRAEVRYLPGLEIRTNSATGETLHVISASAGVGDVRVLHWLECKPEQAINDQLRYSLSDHLGSSTLELDSTANLISQETYYPFGGTSWWAGRNALEASYKTIRYSGKERDATGLYYYGFRYYAPWLCRWVNPDPAGISGGVNLYAMVGNNPVGRIDQKGLAPVELNDTLKGIAERTAIKLFSSGMSASPFAAVNRLEEIQNTQAWMHDEIRRAGFSRGRYGAATWNFAKDNFFGREKKLAEDIIAMTPGEKEGLHLFWSTNAGARYINSAARSLYAGQPAANVSFAEASNEALRELRGRGGEHTVGLSVQRKSRAYDPAVKRLQEHSNHPRGMTKIFENSLGARMQKKVFRGARMPKASMEFLIKGREVTTSGFTAFSPDQEEAKKFMGPTYHDEAFHSATAPVLFTLQGGAKAITPVVEEEALVAPDRNFVVDSVTHKARYLEVELKSRHSGGRGLWI